MGEFTVQTEEPDVYDGAIQAFLREGFPQMPRSHTETLEDLTKALVATGQIRYGPMPTPESLVAIRHILRSSIDGQKPIPILMPWGSKKAGDFVGVDIAEYSGLKQLQCLQARVLQVHKPGIELRIRVEDLSGLYLFQDEPGAADASELYVGDFMTLVKILDIPFITLVSEFDLMDQIDFNERARSAEKLFYEYLKASEPLMESEWHKLESWKALSARCWLGKIPMEQRNYYLIRYANQGVHDVDTRMHMLARYFATVLVRRELNGTGVNPEWGKYVKLTFAHPVPGSPETLTSTQLYYRTVHASHAMTHVAPWRARGFLKIEEDRVIPKIMGGNQKPPSNLHEHITHLRKDDLTVAMRTDYLL